MRSFSALAALFAIQISAVVSPFVSPYLIGDRGSRWFGYTIYHGASFFHDSSFKSFGPDSPCTSNEHLQASFPAFMLPTMLNESALNFLALFDSQLCIPKAGKIIKILGVQLSLITDSTTGSSSILLTQDDPPCSLFFHLPASLDSLSLSIDPSQSNGIRLCINSQPATLLPSPLTYCNAETLGANLSPSLGAVVLGDAHGQSARFDLDQLWVLQSPLPLSSCSELSDMILNRGDSSPYPNSAPILVPSSLSVTPPSALTSDGSFLSDTISISLAISDPDGDPIKARMIMFGALPERQCSAPGCGDRTVEEPSPASPSSSIWLNSSYTYPRAGKYLARVEATDGRGGIFTHDFHLVVRKDGDVNRTAPCCRYSGSIVAAQQGRPIHSTVFRHPRLYSYARDLGWARPDSNIYMDTEDLESERLFDYSILAPGPVFTYQMAIDRVTCLDTRIGGAGGVRVQGVGSRDLNLGHNKRLLIIPQGYDWALNVTLPERPWCQSHWSNWASTSPYKTPISTPIDMKLGQAFCSYACTREGVEATIEFTGLFDRWMERLIETSYGRVSFSHLIDIAPTVWLPRNNTQPNVYLYNDAPTRSYLSSLGIEDASSLYRAVFVLAPMPLQLPLSLRETGWSSAPTFAYLMQCNPQSYYLHHEMGHLFGLPHASVYKLSGDATSGSLPVDPLGPGIVEDSYSDPFDTMACCKGDYSVYSRIMAGWIGSSERIDLDLVNHSLNSNPGAAPVASTTAEYLLWPFDRGESKGRMKSITLRISDDQILVLSYRSNALWQDVRVGGEGSTSAQDQALDPSSTRGNTAGLTVEYLKRLGFDPATSEPPQWSGRGLIDLNLLFPLWPDAFPTSSDSNAPSPSPRAAYAAMKEGFVWTDAARGLQIAIIRSSQCPSLPVNVTLDGSPDLNLNLEPYRYSALGFYGFRGEYPGTEQFDRSDYSGYAQGLPCLTVRVRSGPEVKEPGRLGIRVRVGSLNNDMQLDLRGHGSGYGLPQVPPSLEIIWPSSPSSSAFSTSSSSAAQYEDPPLSIVWKDSLNETFRSGADSLSTPLPVPLLPLTASSAQGAARCTGPRCPQDNTYWVKAAAMSGAHTLVKIQVTSLSILTGYTLKVTYFYFTTQEVVVEEETQTVPILLFTPISPNPSNLSHNTSSEGAAWSQAMGVQLSPRPESVAPVTSFTLLGLNHTLAPTPILPLGYSRPGLFTLPSSDQHWTFTFKLQIILDPRSMTQANGSGGTSQGPSLTSMISGLPSSQYPLVTFTLLPGSSSMNDTLTSTLSSGLYLLPSPPSSPSVSLLARVIWRGRLADVDLTPALAFSYTNSSQPSSARVPFHLVWVRDGPRMGVWANGLGGWLGDELACDVPTPISGPKSTLRFKCPVPPPASSSGTNSTVTSLPPFVLLGPGHPSSPSRPPSALQASLIAISSSRIYNYALPPSDLQDEARCSVSTTDGGCALSFNLLTDPTAASSSPFPPPPAGTIRISRARYDLSPPPPQTSSPKESLLGSSTPLLLNKDTSWSPLISQEGVRVILGLKATATSPSSFSQGSPTSQPTIQAEFKGVESSQGKGLPLGVIAGVGVGAGVALLALVVWVVVVVRGRRIKVAQVSQVPPVPPAQPHASYRPRQTKRARTRQEEEEEERIERALAATPSSPEGRGGAGVGGIGRSKGAGILSSPVLRSSRKPPLNPNPPSAPRPITRVRGVEEEEGAGGGSHGLERDAITPSRVRVLPAAAVSPTRSRSRQDPSDQS